MFHIKSKTLRLVLISQLTILLMFIAMTICIEKYISDHSLANFSHSICPDCVKKLYPEFGDEKIKPVE